MKGLIKQPEECTSLDDVRLEIDRIDREILNLLHKRFQYVKEVVKFKLHNKDSIAARKRYKSVIKVRGEWAKELGLNSTVIKKVYKLLLDYFIKEEMKIAKLNK